MAAPEDDSVATSENGPLLARLRSSSGQATDLSSMRAHPGAYQEFFGNGRVQDEGATAASTCNDAGRREWDRSDFRLPA
jgi:hypothetical protein